LSHINVVMEFLVKALKAPLADDRTYVVAAFSGAVLLIVVAIPYYNLVRTVNPAPTDIKQKKYQSSVRSFRSFFNEVLPEEFQCETAFEAFSKWCSKHHDLGIITTKTGATPRYSSVWIRLVIKTISLLLSNVVLAFGYQRMVFNCHDSKSEAVCQSERSIPVLGNFCTWDASQEQCNEVSVTLAFVIVVVFVVALVASGTDKFMQFTVSHAQLAVRNQRMSWLYCCFIKAPSLPPSLMKRGRIAVLGKTVRVVPAPFADDLERGSDTSLEEERGFAARGKPALAAGRVGGIAGRLALLLPVKLPFKKYPMTISAGVHTHPVSLGQLLQAEEGALQHYGDEWLALSVQSRKAT
jgi:hypothetical protein